MDPEQVKKTIERCRRRAVIGRPLDDPHLDGLFAQDPKNIYYRFLYYLAGAVKPDLVVELGVAEGRSTAHLAAGWPDARVVAVDPERGEMLGPNVFDHYDNVEFYPCRSDDEAMLLDVPDRSVGLLFVDSVHNLPHVLTEMRCWLPKMRPNAPMIFDDLDYFWSMKYLLEAVGESPAALPLEHRGRLDGLHVHGFGYGLAEPDLRLEFERTPGKAEELTITYWRLDGERHTIRVPG